MDRQVKVSACLDGDTMEFRLTGRLIGDKLRDRTTYVLAAIVGTLINLYGQLLVPWFRGGANPFETFANHLQDSPGLTYFSIFLGYAFPFCVGIYSGVWAGDRAALRARGTGLRPRGAGGAAGKALA